MFAREYATVPCQLYRPPIMGNFDLIVGDPILALDGRMMVPVLPMGDPTQQHSINSQRDSLQTFIFAQNEADYFSNLAGIDEGWTLVDSLLNRQYVVRGVDHYCLKNILLGSPPYVHLRVEFVKVLPTEADETDVIHSQ